MASFFSRFIHGAVLVFRHPATTVVSLITGIGTLGVMVGQVDNGIGQLAALHVLSPHMQASAQQAELSLGAVAGIALVLASTGQSLLHNVSPPEPAGVVPPDGGADVLPFTSLASEHFPVSTESTLIKSESSTLVERKAA